MLIRHKDWTKIPLFLDELRRLFEELTDEELEYMKQIAIKEIKGSIPKLRESEESELEDIRILRESFLCPKEYKWKTDIQHQEKETNDK